MFLWFLENTQDKKAIKTISRIDLFSSWMNDLSSREHSKRELLPSETILKVWKQTAWMLYSYRKNNEKLFKDDVVELIQEKFNDINAEEALATFDTLFEWKSDCLTGTFHEQFMEYLVADLLIDACYEQKAPYPDFLKIVLRPEINRYFREIWRGLPKGKKEKIYNSIEKQYFDNIGKETDEETLIRVHAIYHLCRLDSSKRDSTIKRAFQTEKNMSVLLSLYFGAIKLGQLDKEDEFFNLLKQDDYSKANRGYHLTYYADIIQFGALPYVDDGTSDWQGTLKAFERHFISGQLEHFFLWRIDLFTMKELVKARKRVLPLTNELVKDISRIISTRSFKEYEEFYEKIEQEKDGLLDEIAKYSES